MSNTSEKDPGVVAELARLATEQAASATIGAAMRARTGVDPDEARQITTRELAAAAHVAEIIMRDVEARLPGVLDEVLAAEDLPNDEGRDRDVFDEAGAEFAAALRRLLGEREPVGLDIEEAARTAAARQLWEEELGELVSPQRFGELIGVTRQRVQRLCSDQAIVAMQDRRGRWNIPAWQASLTAEGRERLADAVSTFERAGVSPWSAASWLVTEHPELDGRTPRDLVADPGLGDRLVTVAARDAAQ